ncbi:head maturation protease [Vibrio phage D51]
MTKQTIKEFWLDSSFKIKEMPDEQDNSKLTVAGYASTVSEDRAGDIIPMSAWENKEALDNYLKNPIILFQHDHDEPIGKMVDYQIDETGLYVEIEIFNVDQRVYKLVKEGVLKAFSVGFRMKDYKYDQDKGVFIITELELFEISVVSIPCNQDSTFSLKKSMKDSDFAALRTEAITKATAEAESTQPQTPAFNSELEKLAYLLANQ